ncbi:MAG: hypothetical protein OEY56_08465 [Cyclobacteriaceae bacterium]|nr:hypothetical protein [Cyclobacteriaceae bacterium]
MKVEKGFRIAFVYLFLVALIGTLLRLSILYPLSFSYPYVLHAHSHVAFMGWLFNGVFLLTLGSLDVQAPWIKRQFVGYQIAILGMLISFPLQGYGPVSISFSTLHIVISIWFLVKVWPLLPHIPYAEKWIKAGLVFMVISAGGPFTLGPLAALGYKDTIWYDLSIQFYLHFFFNGWFFMALAGLMSHHFSIDTGRGFTWMVGAMVPLFFTSVMVFDQSGWVRVLSLAGSVGFGMGVYHVLVVFRPEVRQPKQQGLFAVLVISLLLKTLFQVVINLADVAVWVAGLHHLVIGFLHLTFLGVLTPAIFILAEKYVRISRVGLLILLAGYVITEASLFLGFVPGFSWIYQSLFAGAIILLLGTGWLLAFLRRQD